MEIQIFVSALVEVKDYSGGYILRYIDHSLPSCRTDRKHQKNCSNKIDPFSKKYCTRVWRKRLGKDIASIVTSLAHPDKHLYCSNFNPIHSFPIDPFCLRGTCFRQRTFLTAGAWSVFVAITQQGIQNVSYRVVKFYDVFTSRPCVKWVASLGWDLWIEYCISEHFRLQF